MLLVIAFAGYLVLHRDALALAGRRVAVRRPAARPRPRPDPGDVAGQPRHPGLPARPRLVPAVLRPVPGHALRRHRAARLARRRRRRCSSAGAYARLRASRPRRRAASTLWLRPVWAHYGDGTDDKGLPDRRGDVRHGLGRPDRPRPRPGHPRGGSRSPTPTSSSASIGEELGLTGVDRGDPALRPDRRARAAHRADLPRRLRQAARHRPRRRRSRSRCSWSSAASPS